MKHMRFNDQQVNIHQSHILTAKLFIPFLDHTFCLWTTLAFGDVKVMSYFNQIVIFY